MNPIDFPSLSFPNITLEEILSKILAISKGQASNTAIIRVGNEMISLNITKLPPQSQESLDLKDQAPLKKCETSDAVKKGDTLENSDSLVRHISDKDEFLSNLPNLLKCETFPLNYKVLRAEQRPFSMDALKDFTFPDKKLIKSFSQKVLKESEKNTIFPISLEPKTRKYSNDVDFSLSVSKESFSRRIDSKLHLKGEHSLNLVKETSLNLISNLHMNKAMSMNKYPMNSDENEGSYRNKPIISLQHESFNTLDFNVSKSDSKSGSPLKKKALEIRNMITMENQASFGEYGIIPLNSKGNEELDLEKIEISKSVYVLENSGLLERNEGNCGFNSPLGISKREGSTNRRYGTKKNLGESQTFSNISESEVLMKKSEEIKKNCEENGENRENFEKNGKNEKITNFEENEKNENSAENEKNENSAENEKNDNSFENEKNENSEVPSLQTIEDLLTKTDKESKTYHDLQKTLVYLKKYHEQLLSKEFHLNYKESELSKYERSLKEKEKKLNELLEKTSKSSTQWSLDTISTSHNNHKDPLKELLEEQFADSKKTPIFSVPSDAEIHFIFLYSSVF